MFVSAQDKAGALSQHQQHPLCRSMVLSSLICVYVVLCCHAFQFNNILLPLQDEM